MGPKQMVVVEVGTEIAVVVVAAVVIVITVMAEGDPL